MCWIKKALNPAKSLCKQSTLSITISSLELGLGLVSVLVPLSFFMSMFVYYLLTLPPVGGSIGGCCCSFCNVVLGCSPRTIFCHLDELLYSNSSEIALSTSQYSRVFLISLALRCMYPCNLSCG